MRCGHRHGVLAFPVALLLLERPGLHDPAEPEVLPRRNPLFRHHTGCREEYDRVAKSHQDQRGSCGKNGHRSPIRVTRCCFHVMRCSRPNGSRLVSARRAQETMNAAGRKPTRRPINSTVANLGIVFARYCIWSPRERERRVASDQIPRAGTRDCLIKIKILLTAA